MTFNSLKTFQIHLLIVLIASFSLIGSSILIPNSSAEKEIQIPSWIKNNAGWWADGQIDDGSFVSGIQWLISNGIIIVEERLTHTDIDLRVAFIADQGNTAESIAVLNLIKHEGAQMVLHQGDFDYDDDPDAWDRTISNGLGDNFPYFASIGHHDMKAWNGYQEKLYDRLIIFKAEIDIQFIEDISNTPLNSSNHIFFINRIKHTYSKLFS